MQSNIAPKAIISRNAIILLDATKNNKPVLFAERVRQATIRSNQRLNINIQDQQGNSPLHYAVKNQAYDWVKFLIEYNVNFSLQNKEGLTPLGIALQTQNQLIINLLTTAIKLDEQKRQETAWVGAIDQSIHKYGNKIIKQYLEAIKDKSPEDSAAILNYYNDLANTKYGVCLLQLAILLDKKQYFFKILLTNPAQVNIENKIGGAKAVHLAAILNQQEIVKYLIETHGVNVDERSRTQQTALHYSASLGYHDLVSYLINSAHANVNVKDDEGRTPLHLAAKGKHESIVNDLLQNPLVGTYLDIEGKIWNKERYVTLNEKNFLRIMDKPDNFIKFLEAGLEFNEVQVVGASLTFNLINNNFKLRKEALSVLINHPRFNINAINTIGDHILHELIDKLKVSHKERVEFLVQNSNIDINAQNIHGETALFLAIKKNKFDFDNNAFIHYLINEAKIDINIQANDGSTALFAAIETGAWQSVRFLVQAKADIHHYSLFDSALNLAIAKNDPLVLASLNSSISQHPFIDRYLITPKEYIAANPDHVKKDNKSILLNAAKKHYPAIVKTIIKFTLSIIDTQDDSLNTALHYAVINQDINLVKFLVSQNADLILKNKDKMSSLQLAIKINKENDIAKFLIESNLKLTKQKKICFQKPLTLEYINKLIEEKVNLPTYLEINGNSLLHQAVIDNNLVILIFLLDHGFIVDMIYSRNKERFSLLDIAIRLDSEAIALFLLDQSNFKIYSDPLGIPIIETVYLHKHIKLMEMFSIKCSPLFTAAMNQDLAAMKKLVEMKTDFTEVNCSGDSLLFSILTNPKDPDFNMATYLIKEAGLDVNYINITGKHILHELISKINNPTSQVKFLVDNSMVDINAQNARGETILHLVDSVISKEFLNYLVTIPNLDCNIKTNNGLTPVFIAIQNFMDLEKVIAIHTHMEIDFNQNGNRLLKVAIDTRNRDLIKYILTISDRKIDLNSTQGKLIISLLKSSNLLNTIVLECTGLELTKIAKSMNGSAAPTVTTELIASERSTKKNKKAQHQDIKDKTEKANSKTKENNEKLVSTTSNSASTIVVQENHSKKNMPHIPFKNKFSNKIKTRGKIISTLSAEAPIEQLANTETVDIETNVDQNIEFVKPTVHIDRIISRDLPKQKQDETLAEAKASQEILVLVKEKLETKKLTVDFTQNEIVAKTHAKQQHKQQKKQDKYQQRAAIQFKFFSSEQTRPDNNKESALYFQHACDHLLRLGLIYTDNQENISNYEAFIQYYALHRNITRCFVALKKSQEYSIVLDKKLITDIRNMQGHSRLENWSYQKIITLSKEILSFLPHDVRQILNDDTLPLSGPIINQEQIRLLESAFDYNLEKINSYPVINRTYNDMATVDENKEEDHLMQAIFHDVHYSLIPKINTILMHIEKPYQHKGGVKNNLARLAQDFPQEIDALFTLLADCGRHISAERVDAYISTLCSTEQSAARKLARFMQKCRDAIRNVEDHEFPQAELETLIKFCYKANSINKNTVAISKIFDELNINHTFATAANKI